MEHEHYMREAIWLAIESGKSGNGAFGAVLVHGTDIIATARNDEIKSEGFGHAEYNLAIKSALQFPDAILRESTLYTSGPPCPRCALAILAIGVRRIVVGVSYEAFARLLPFETGAPSIHHTAHNLGLDVEVLGPVLEEEGLRAFEYWGGEHHPIEELLLNAQMARERSNS